MGKYSVFAMLVGLILSTSSISSIETHGTEGIKQTYYRQIPPGLTQKLKVQNFEDKHVAIEVGQYDANSYLSSHESEGAANRRPVVLHLYGCGTGVINGSHTWQSVIEPKLWHGYTNSVKFETMVHDAEEGKKGW